MILCSVFASLYAIVCHICANLLLSFPILSIVALHFFIDTDKPRKYLSIALHFSLLKFHDHKKECKLTMKWTLKFKGWLVLLRKEKSENIGKNWQKLVKNYPD